MVLLSLLVIGIVFSLGLIVSQLVWAGVALSVIWAAGWVIRLRGGRWYVW